MDQNPAPASRQAVIRAFEPLWIAATGTLLIVGGAVLLPRLIRLMGRGGAVETVEWAVYMSMLTVFPLAVMFVGWILPRVAGARAASVVERALVLLIAVAFAGWTVVGGASLVMKVAAAAFLSGMSLVLLRIRGDRSRETIAVAAACGVVGWMAAGSLIYWESALKWVTQSPVTILILAVTVVFAAASLRSWVSSSDAASAIRVLDLIPLALLIAFSFRTFPMVEHYHWGFFVGPIEELRQGGTLLWDTPSQYGFLSILLPSLLPGNAWQSFWFFQAVTYAAVASILYLAIRRLSPGWHNAVLAFVFTFAALFFRPRSDALMLPAQMTPAAGPFRFIPCFVMLAFLVGALAAKGKQADAGRFALKGTTVWIVAVLWSAETAIYVTAMWFPALLIYALQHPSAQPLSPGRSIKSVAKAAIYPMAAIVVAGAIVFVSYKLAGLPGPDITGHFEYVLLYSRGGFGALPIAPTGVIWYLIVVFLVVSTLLALHAQKNPRDPRLIVWAACWGGVWAIASYFTGRSHPVNLIALVPLLAFIVVACLRMSPFAVASRGRYAVAATVLPLFVMPIVSTTGHREFPDAVTEAQLSPGNFTDQIKRIDPELQNLLVSAGAKQDDSFVLASDGRLMLEAWTAGPTAKPVTLSWLPKPFEIIGSLPDERREVYLRRNARSFSRQGWLITSKTLEANGGEHLEQFVETSRPEIRRHESANWVVRLLGPPRTPER